MQSTPRTIQRELDSTPTLRGLLARLERRLSALIWISGAGWVLACLGAWLAWAFTADFALHLPRPLRVLNALIALGVLIFAVVRFLVRPLSRRPGRAGLAELVERRHPALGELLISAVELQTSSAPSGDPARVRAVLADAEVRARALDLRGVLDSRRPQFRLALGLASMGLLATAALVWPTHASVFLDRFWGGQASWPQRTHLSVSIPLSAERADQTVSDERLSVRVVRGSDVPVLVEARGEEPDEVVLTFDDERELTLAAGGDGSFRTLLRGVQERLSFRARGGDDRDGAPEVVIDVLDPPDLAGLCIAVEPPAYTGLAPSRTWDHDVQVPAGSNLQVTILPHPAEARGTVRLLPADQAIELEPRPFRASEAADAPELPGLGFSLAANDSLRLRFELHDPSGLSNPDPGLYSIEVLEDRAPELELVMPSKSEIETVARGMVRLILRARDDYGVAGIRWTARRALAADLEPATGELELVRLEPAGANVRSLCVASLRRPIAELAPGDDATLEGDQVLIDLQALDNRPTPNLGKAPALRVRIVAEEDFLRRIQDRLARLRVQVAEIEELERGKAARVQELLASLESDAPERGSNAGELALALSGERRVKADAESATREFASLVEAVLYSQIDDKAGALLEELDRALSSARDREFQIEGARALVRARNEGRGGSAASLAGQLVGLLELALGASHGDLALSTSALERAGQALELEDVHAALSQAKQHQTAALRRLEELLARLAEWDNFQSVLSLTKDILNRQKSLIERTRSSAQEK